ncbi:hypothetical protein [Flavobacterium selenitireducens]|uniref:hypothetical protein n=1 Tax=Flavobacterium selenitireducens TaxID=2722704 RepID=UPI00168A6014|nr:hypothetical protein [Flavobacterium selenitireducens]MBD3584071.1 hypothetical protein [Flavobacterium selenitireducens]
MNDGEIMLSLMEELREMPEFQTLEKIRHFGISLEIFEGNYGELVRHLEIHNNPRISMELMGVRNKAKLHAFRKEITRHLHNYIASALSLTDHARNHYRELYSHNDLFPEYQEEINKRFANNKLAVFIKDLRQYFQHYQVPGVSTRLVYKKDAPEFIMTFLLTIKGLRKFSGWHKLSQEFLREQTDDIDLLFIVNQYHKLILDFYDWFISKQLVIHEDDQIKVELHKEKMRKLEVMRILMDLLIHTPSPEDFETDLHRIFSDDEIDIMDITSGHKKIELIMNLLSQIKDLSEEERNSIFRVYQSNNS